MRDQRWAGQAPRINGSVWCLSVLMPWVGPWSLCHPGGGWFIVGPESDYWRDAAVQLWIVLLRLFWVGVAVLDMWVLVARCSARGWLVAQRVIQRVTVSDAQGLAWSCVGTSGCGMDGWLVIRMCYRIRGSSYVSFIILRFSCNPTLALQSLHYPLALVP